VVHISAQEGTMHDFIEYREQARIRERRERAYALFCRMRPHIRNAQVAVGVIKVS